MTRFVTVTDIQSSLTRWGLYGPAFRRACRDTYEEQWIEKMYTVGDRRVKLTQWVGSMG